MSGLNKQEFPSKSFDHILNISQDAKNIYEEMIERRRTMFRNQPYGEVSFEVSAARL